MCYGFSYVVDLTNDGVFIYYDLKYQHDFSRDFLQHEQNFILSFVDRSCSDSMLLFLHLQHSLFQLYAQVDGSYHALMRQPQNDEAFRLLNFDMVF